MTIKKYVVYTSISIILILIITLSWYWRFWPFTKGSDTPAFLGTTFEMTLSEVQRTLKKSGIQLIDKATFKKNHPDISKKSVWFLDFQPDFIEDSSKIESWYMPPLEMFNSYVIGEFNFNNDRLISIDSEFFPFRDVLSDIGLTKDNEKVIATIVSSLEEKKYKLVKTEASKTIPGAYNQFFEGKKSKVNLWVNLTDPKEPIIDIYITYTQANDFRKKEVERRENNAF